MRYMTSEQKRWVRWASWLLMVSSLVLLPVPSNAAQQAPQFGPTGYLPYLKNNYCAGRRSTEAPLGTQIYGPTGYTTAHFQLLQSTSSAWLRNTIYWDLVEPNNVSPKHFAWDSVDIFLNAAHDNCINMIVTIDGTPAWARFDGNRDGRSPILTENLPDYVEFVTALVERYDGDGVDDAPNGIVVNYWEFYNEPDFGSEVSGHEGWGEYGARYAQMLAAIYEPVHEANPNAKVLLGGLAYTQFVSDSGDGLHVRDFFKNVLAAGGGDYFDIMNFHYYPFQHNRYPLTQTNASGLIEKYAQLKEIMDTYHVVKPLMITEVGYHSTQTDQQYPSTPEFQARRVVELLTQGMSLGSQATIWWSFFDERQTFPFRTGLTTADETPVAKASYGVYQEVIKRLGNSEFIETTVQPTVENDLEVYRFRDKRTNKTFYVAWLNPVAPFNQDTLPTFDDTVTQTVDLFGVTATIISKEGGEVGVVHDGDDGTIDGKVNVTIGRSPVYVVISE